MRTKKILITVFSLLVVGVFAFSITWGVINFNKVQEGMSGTGLYTREDINNAYDDGYGAGVKDKAEYTILIAEYRDTVTTLNDNISQLNFQVATLTNSNLEYANQVDELSNQKTDLEVQVANLKSIKDTNEATINELNDDIINLQKQVIALEKNGEDKSEQIVQLNTQIAGLQNLVAQLQITNDLNLTTINSLNEQIAGLNKQINDLNAQIYNKNNELNDLNSEILRLKKSVANYEDYIASLENGARIVAIFEVDGSIYNIQTLSGDESIVVPEIPVSDRYVFNGWMIDGESIDLSIYEIVENTKFVADLIYSKRVNFVVDGEVYNTEYLTDNNKFVSAPNQPVKDGFDFDGWSLDGVNVVDLGTLEIDDDIVLYAKFTELFTVNFMLDNSLIETKNVRDGDQVLAPVVESNDGKYLNGWLLNDNVIDLKRFNVTSSLVLVANMVEPGFYETSVGGPVSINYDAFYVSKDNEIFYLPGNSTNYFSNPCRFDKYTGRMSVIDNDIWADIIGRYLWCLDDTLYYSYGNIQLVYDVETNTWNEKKWNGLTYFNGDDIWQLSDEVYYSNGGTSYQYVLNKATSTWSKKTWNGLTSFYGKDIWQYKGNVIYSDNNNHYVYNEFQDKWSSFNFVNSIKFYGRHIVELGGNFYCFNQYTGLYLLEKKQWVKIAVSPFVSGGFKTLFTDKDSIFAVGTFSEIVHFDFLTSEWNEIVPTCDGNGCVTKSLYSLYDETYLYNNGVVYEFDSSCRKFIETDYSVPSGFNIDCIFEWRNEYYYADDNVTYKYDVVNHLWQEIDMAYKGAGLYYWSDGEFLYFSFGNYGQYVYDTESNQWNEKVWNIPSVNLVIERIVKFNGNVYYSDYILNHETQEWENAGFNISIGVDSDNFSVFNGGLYYYKSNKYYLLDVENNVFEEVSMTNIGLGLLSNSFCAGDELIAFDPYSVGFNFYVYVGARETNNELVSINIFFVDSEAA